jgi:nitrile hydratase accessory protein
MPGNPILSRADAGRAESGARALIAVPGLRGSAAGPVFREPWEAQAFAMTLVLETCGAFTWAEWAAALGEEIRRAQAAGDADSGATYYRHWLATLERLVTEKGIASAAALAQARQAWSRASERTPPGMPVVLTVPDSVR